MGLGAIPLASLWGFSIIAQVMNLNQSLSGVGITIVGLVLAGIARVIQLVWGIALLSTPVCRVVGYGMLAILLISALVAQQECVLIFQVGRA